MTCELNEQNPLDALYRTCRDYPGGIEALAARMGKKPYVMYSKLRRQVETHRIGYDEELSEILFCLEEARVKGWADTLHSFCWRHGHVAFPIPRIVEDGKDHGMLSSLILKTIKEQGDVAERISEAIGNDEKIDSAEFQKIEAEFEESLAAMLSLRQWVREKHEQAKTKGLVR